MTPHLVFFRFEIRRHVPALVVASLGLLGLPLLLALQGSWRYWEGPGGEFWTTLVPYLLAPWVVGWIASHSWAEDRSQRTLEWLEARPIGAFQFYQMRLLAVLVPIVIWFCLAYLSMWPLFRTRSSDYNGLGYNLALLLALSFGFGSFFSALVERPGKALVLSVISTYCFHLLMIAFVLRQLSGPIRRGLFDAIGQTGLWWVTVTFELLIPVGILLMGTWAMVKICPGDPRRWIRGARVLLLGGVAYIATLVAMATWF